MIYGIGTDLCDVGRIEKSIARPAFFAACVYPGGAGAHCRPYGQEAGGNRRGQLCCKRSIFESLRHRPFRVLHGGNRRPAPAKRCALPEFTGKAARFMAQNHLQAHLSLTHEAGLAGAFVVLERVE